jgi:molybdopterin-guanine dinucleotide biosynthesis protein A
MAEQQAIVAVLAGGQGTRMGAGAEKATVALGARALICHPLAAARAAGLETVVVAKQATALPPLGEQVLFEPDSPQHPLCGVVTALEFAAKRSPAPAVLMLACDMPFLTGALLAWLAGLEGAVMVQVDGRPQPLLARWLPEHLHAVQEALDAKCSLRAAISTLAPRIVAERELSRFGDPARLCFNVNDAEDLARAEGLL